MNVFQSLIKPLNPTREVKSNGTKSCSKDQCSSTSPLPELYNMFVLDSLHNISPGVGGSCCPFELDSYVKFQNEASPKAKERLIEIIFYARICNGGKGQRRLKVPPGKVKVMIKELLEFLKAENTPKIQKSSRRKKKK